MIKIVLTFCLALIASGAWAANINIGPNGCTLADAITAANVNAPVGNCASGSGSDFIIAPDGWQITLTSSLPTISSDMTIRSATPAGIVYISGNDQRRVFRITGNNTDVTLQRLEIGGGRTTNSAGAGVRIENATVRIEDSAIIANEARNATGDGIYVVGGDLTLYRTRVQANSSNGVASSDAAVNIVESYFTFNSKVEGGSGLSVTEGTELLVERSLFREFNGVAGHASVAEIVNSTFNYVDPEGYIPHSFRFSGFSLVELNHVTTTTKFRMIDSILSASNSFLGTCELFSSQVILDTGNTSRMGNCLDNFGIGPTLLPLADNGGPTRTMAIASAGSEAIHGGDPAYCQALDQRGEARGDSCDIGAYEASGFADVSVSASIEPGGPHVSSQPISYYAELENLGPGVATNVRVSITSSNTFITSVNSPFCSALPCVVSSIQPGQTLTIPIEMNMGGHLSGPFAINLSALSTAASTHVDENEDNPNGNNFESLSGPVNPGADMAVTMHLLSAGPYFEGQTLQYQAQVSNAGPQTATGVQLHFAPANLTEVVFTGCASAAGVICDIANIGSGASRTINIEAEVSGPQFDAAATVSAAQVDIDSANNVDDRDNGGGVTTADVGVTATFIETAPYYSYQYLSLEVVVSTGSNPASNIRLDYLFPGAELIDIQACGGFPCVIPQLAANSQITLLAQFFAPIAISGENDFLGFRVWVTPGQQDTNPANNTAIVTGPLLPTAEMAAQLALATPPPYYAGQEIAYTLRVPNSGVNAVSDIDIDATPQNLTLVSAFGTLCPTLGCTIDYLNAFDEENMTLVYRIDNAGAFDLVATAYASEHDSAPGNNTDSTGNGGTAEELPIDRDVIFPDGFE